MIKMILEGTLVTKILRNRGRLRRFYSSYVTSKMKKELALLDSDKYLGYSDNVKTADITISLTSYDKRLHVLPLTLISLLRQSLMPKQIIVWLTEEDLELFKKSNFYKHSPSLIEYRSTFDYRSHKKWLPVLLFTKIDKFIICDDDTYYPSGWLSGILKEDFKGQVGGRCHNIIIENDKVQSYSSWQKEVDIYLQNGHQIFPTGCGGVVIRRKNIPKPFLEYDLIKELCPMADDVWLKFAHIVSGVKSKKAKYSFPCIEFMNSQEESLASVNVDRGLNDEQINNCIKYFNIDLRLLNDEK